MFEKDAEEYATKKVGDFKPIQEDKETEWTSCCEDFQKGAEHGYNKANEWHYVKDGLPDEGTYLVVWQNDKGYKEIFIMKYDEDDEEQLHWVDGDYEDEIVKRPYR